MKTEDLVDVLRGASEREVSQALRELTRDELIALTDSTADWSDDRESKFDLYKAVPVGQAFHESPAKIRAAFGGNRSSKTTSAMVDCISQAIGRYPKSVQAPSHRFRGHPIYIRWSTVDRVNGIQKIAFDAFNRWTPLGSVLELKRDLMVADFINGSKIEFMSYEQEPQSFQGTARHIVAHDEEPPQSIWTENLLRTIGAERGEVILSMTPINGMTWSYDGIWMRAGRRTIYLDGIMRTVELPDGDPDIHVFLYDTYDNQYLTAADLKDVERLITNPDERDVRFHGKFLSFAGLVYKEWSDDVHIVEDFAIPKSWPVYVSLDPHPRTEHAYLMVAVDPKGQIFVIDEFFQHANYDQLATMIKVKEKDRWVLRRVIDPWAEIEDQLTHTTLSQELRNRGVNFLPASKDRARGIMAVNNALHYERKGTEFTIRPKVFCFRSCKRFRWEIARYVWDDYRRDTDRNVKQTPKDKDDHMMENLYRLLLCEPRWFDKAEFDRPLAPRAGQWAP
jgi:phage terminase large subunit-like protein